MKTTTNQEEDIKPKTTQVPIEEKVDKESCADISALPPPAEQEPSTAEDSTSAKLPPLDGTENSVEAAPQEEVGIKYFQ